MAASESLGYSHLAELANGPPLPRNGGNKVPRFQPLPRAGGPAHQFPRGGRQHRTSDPRHLAELANRPDTTTPKRWQRTAPGSGRLPDLTSWPARSPRWRQHRALDPATSLNWRTDHHFAEVAVTECPACSHFAEPAEPATTTPKWWQRSAPDLATSPNWQTPPRVPRDGAAECSGCSQLPNSRAGRHFPDVVATTCPGSSHFAGLASRATTRPKWWQRTALDPATSPNWWAGLDTTPPGFGLADGNHHVGRVSLVPSSRDRRRRPRRWAET